MSRGSPQRCAAIPPMKQKRESRSRQNAWSSRGASYTGFNALEQGLPFDQAGMTPPFGRNRSRLHEREDHVREEERAFGRQSAEVDPLALVESWSSPLRVLQPELFGRELHGVIVPRGPIARHSAELGRWIRDQRSPSMALCAARPFRIRSSMLPLSRSRSGHPTGTTLCAAA